MTQEDYQGLYNALRDTIVSSGKRILGRAGRITDIGVLKQDLTEEDLRIERELSDLILAKHPDHKVYAEEEHDAFEQSEHVWAIDPISGTAAFIAGLPHYALVLAHLVKGEPRFAVVYDPAVDECFTAQAGQGAYLNGRRIQVSGRSGSVVFNLAKPKSRTPEAVRLWPALSEQYQTYRNANSFAVNYCAVAAGRYDGVVSVAKDAFPEFAGRLMITEAGGSFTNAEGSGILPTDRYFAGGNEQTYGPLLEILQVKTKPISRS